MSRDGELVASYVQNVTRSQTDSGIIAIPGPATILGDVDQNGIVTFADIAPFIAILTSNAFLDEADVNQDNEVNFLDILPLIGILAGG